MSLKEYQLIPEESSIHYDGALLNPQRRRTFSSRSLIAGIVLIILALSLSANSFWVIQHIKRNADGNGSGKTVYAGLELNVPVAWNHDSGFASHNRTTWDRAWGSLNPDAGLVAISDHFVEKTGLPQAQRWPWDQSKGLYLLQGYHNLHCLTIIRNSLTEMHDKVPQTTHFTHVNHCLDAIRQDIICNADDTPRYTGFTHGSPLSGIGQVRMCRDWEKLEQWAQQNSACYHYKPVETPDGIPLGNFKTCPDGSKPWKALGIE